MFNLSPAGAPVNGIMVLQGLRGEDSAVDLHRPFLRWLMKKVRGGEVVLSSKYCVIYQVCP